VFVVAKDGKSVNTTHQVQLYAPDQIRAMKKEPMVVSPSSQKFVAEKALRGQAALKEASPDGRRSTDGVASLLDYVAHAREGDISRKINITSADVLARTCDFNFFSTEYGKDILPFLFEDALPILYKEGTISQEELAAKEKAKTILSTKLSGKILVEPGCGYGNDGIEITERFSAEGYIGIDKRTISDRTSRIEAKIICMDMLSFIARLPDASVNFMFNGIEFNIINDERYWVRLGWEVWRATEKGGIVFGMNSHPVITYFNHFNRITPPTPWREVRPDFTKLI
jgi:hypothetical protein